MRRRVLLLLPGIVAVAVGGVMIASVPARAPSVCWPTLVPAYAGPQAVTSLAERDAPPALVIVNPHNGVGAASQSAYAAAVKRAQRAGIKVIGYVSTAYGKRAASEVLAEAERYRRWYGVDGIFLDETSHHAADLPYYRGLSDRLRPSAHPLVFNPGVVPARAYFDLADVVVTFEGPFRDYREALARRPGWLGDQPAGSIAHLVYAASPADAETVAALRPHAGFVYVTAGVLPDPWGSVRGYAPAGNHGVSCD